MECNKEEAIRAKKMAENKMTNNDFEGAHKLALKAQKLFPELDNISQILTVCDVHCSAQKKINNTQMDLYGILQVENLADEVTIKKQYRKLALVLHPDKNKSPGAESAFKLICEANTILSDKGKRYLYDFKCKEIAKPTIQKPQQHHGSQNPVQFAGQKSKSETNGRSTFWIHCPFCKIKYEYDQALINKQIPCPKCSKIIMGFDSCARRSTVPPNRGPAGAGVLNQGSKTVRPGEQETGTSSKRTQVGDEKNPGKKLKVSSSGVQKDKIEEENNKSNSDLNVDMEAVYIDCKDPEFTNFDKEKEKDCFEVDQIWACYDPIDTMPRFYAQIRKVYKSGFRVRITWLEAAPESQPEIRWADEGLPVSCGKFVRGETEEIRDRVMFSHRITFSNGKKRSSYMIYPKQGEIWALFKDWDISWSSDPKAHMEYKFEIVEVLSDFENDSGALVANMVKVKGFVGLFQKISPTQLVGRKIPPSELFRFSHRVPAVKLTGTERADVPVGSFELDTASLPDDLNEFYVYNESPETPELQLIHDFESERKNWKFQEGEIWAICKPEDQNGKCYAQIKKIESSPLRLHVDLLELCISNNMLRPNACGLYKASTCGRQRILQDSFLYIVKAEMNGKNRFNIYPNEKEIWILYSKQDSKSTFSDVECEVVEVVENNGDMIKVLCLSRVAGYKSVFRASEIEKSKSGVLEIPMAEFNRFCYRVPAFLLTDEEDGRLRGCWEVDLACVSGDLRTYLHSVKC